MTKKMRRGRRMARHRTLLPPITTSPPQSHPDRTATDESARIFLPARLQLKAVLPCITADLHLHFVCKPLFLLTLEFSNYGISHTSYACSIPKMLDIFLLYCLTINPTIPTSWTLEVLYRSRRIHRFMFSLTSMYLYFCSPDAYAKCCTAQIFSLDSSYT